MKTAYELVANILKAVDSTEGDSVRIPKSDAVRIAELLTSTQFVSEAPRYHNGKMVFYCPECEKSFSADGREDRECFEKWHYHAWHAVCPWCKLEVTQNDGYWR